MENLPALRSNIPSEHEMMVYHTMAEQAVSSKMYKGIGEQAGVMMIMLSARELNIPPMQAMNGGLNIINGKVEISARMMSALIRRAGHQIVVKENSDVSCTLIGKRCDTGESQGASFTIQEAQKAGLVKPGGGWTKWPKDMCFARALSRLSRQLFSDVIGIGYVEGEIKASEAEILVPEDVIPQEQTFEEEVDQFQAFTKLFSQEDNYLILQYLELVMGHFSWTKKEALDELLKDPQKLVEKFNIWKNKQKVVELQSSE